MRAGQREDRWYGAAELPNFFRVPHGAGWALVGDAGYHKDPLGAQGIADAFRDAAALPGYEANHAAALAPPSPEARARRDG